MDPDAVDALAPPKDGGAAPPAGEGQPPVVAVIVTHDPGPWFRETLASLRDQSYRSLSVLVIDAGSTEDPTPTIASVLPTAYVRRIGDNPGFGAAANELLGSVEGAAFYLICHDDVVLDGDTVRTLVEEAFRSNAGIVGPKLVDWERPRELRQVGASVDKTGVAAPFAEPGELDQEQHDAVRDVFFVPGGCTLVRADLFTALGGFDAGIDFHGEDLDLCWRSHVAGARVLIVPATAVRHLEAMGVRREGDDRRRLQARHRLRTVLSCYGPFHLLRVLPQAIFFTLVEAVYALVAGQPRQARDVVTAWTWNGRRILQIRSKRKAVRRVRTVSDADVRGLQVRGSARLTAFVRGQIGDGEDRLAGVAQSGRDVADTLRVRSTRTALIVAGVALGLVLLGSRNLVFRTIPTVGEFAIFPEDPATLLRGWISGWSPAGLGSERAAPTALGLLGGMGTLLFGATGLLRTVLILALLPLGLLGAWRLGRPLGSLRAALAAVVVYAAIPVPYNALARGSWGGLVLYAASPWLLLHLARAAQVAPFAGADRIFVDRAGGASRAGRGGATGASGPSAAAWPGPTRWRQVMVIGILVAVVGAFVPVVVAVVAVIALALVAGSLFCGRARGTLGLLGVAAGAIGLAFVLHLPWSVDLVRPGATWLAFAGIRSGGGALLGAGDLLRFETGPFGAPPLGWAYLVAAALPLVIGRGWRFEWAVRTWFLALSGWGLLWAGQEGWIPVELPPPELLLAPVAAALALAAALGVAAFEIDLPGYRFGWRQAVSAIAGLAVLVGIVPLVPGVIDGRWQMPGAGLDRPVDAVLQQDGDTDSRVLWVGDPDVLPAGSWRVDDRLAYATTAGRPSIGDRWAGSDDGATGLLGDALALAGGRRTTRLGALLAPMGVRYVVVPVRSAPAAFDGESRPVPPSFTAMLSDQLDLARVESDTSVIVYRNTAWAGTAAQLPADAVLGDHFTDALDTRSGRETGPPVLERRNATEWAGRVAQAGPVLLAESSSENWRLEVDGAVAKRSTVFGWANRFEVDRAGAVEVRYDTPGWRYLLCGLQVVLWIIALVLLRRTAARRRRVRRSTPAAPTTAGAQSGPGGAGGAAVKIPVAEAPVPAEVGS